MIVARFLALLELFHEAVLIFDQSEALGELVVQWTGQNDGEIGVSDEFDQEVPTGQDVTIKQDVAINEETVTPVE